MASTVLVVDDAQVKEQRMQPHEDDSRRKVILQLKITLLNDDYSKDEDVVDSTKLTQDLTETKDFLELTRNFQALCSSSQIDTSLFTMIKITASSLCCTHSSDMDWTSAAALQFVESMSLMNFRHLIIDQFVHFPFPLLQLFMTRDYFSQISLRNTGFVLPPPQVINMTETTAAEACCSTQNMPFSFQGSFSIHLDDGPVDWTALAGWLQKVKYHPQSSLHISLSTSRQHLKDQQQQHDYEQDFLKTIASFPTKQISICAISLPTSPVLVQALENNPVLQEEVDLVFWDMMFCLSSSKNRLSIHDSHGQNWEDFSNKWLEKTLQSRMMTTSTTTTTNCWKAVSVKVQSKTQKCQEDFFHLISSVPCKELRISSKSVPSWLISKTVLKQLQSNPLLQSLDITMADDDDNGQWIIVPTNENNHYHSDITQALKEKSTMCKMELEVSKVLPELTIALEDVLATNPSLSCVKLRKCVSGIPSLDDEYHSLTPNMKIYLALNQNIHRQVILLQGEDNLTPRQWLDSLTCYNNNNNKESDNHNNLIHLSCIYMTLRKYSSYFANLAAAKP